MVLILGFLGYWFDNDNTLAMLNSTHIQEKLNLPKTHSQSY